MTTTEIKLQIAEPPVERPKSNDDPSKRVIIGNLHRGEESFPGEGSLSVCRTKVVWEFDSIGTYFVSIDSLQLTTTDGLSTEESELIQFWTKEGLSWLMPITPN
jgi:hypothetical protein